MSLARLRTVVASLAAVVLSAGCVQVEYGIDLEEDLSGTMELSLALDVEQMAYGMAMAQRSFGGEEGAPTSEEIAAAREQILADMERERDDFDVATIRREASEDLPEGVELTDASQSDDGLETRLRFRFDHVRRLGEMSISPGGGAGADTAGADTLGPTVEPFGGLAFRDEGDSYLLTNDPVDPVAQAREDGGHPPGMADQMSRMMQEMGGGSEEPMVSFWLDVPFEVLEHNATRAEGQRLYWEYGLDSFVADSTPSGIRVRFRKP